MTATPVKTPLLLDILNAHAMKPPPLLKALEGEGRGWEGMGWGGMGGDGMGMGWDGMVDGVGWWMGWDGMGWDRIGDSTGNSHSHSLGHSVVAGEVVSTTGRRALILVATNDDLW